MGLALGLGKGRQYKQRIELYTREANKASVVFRDAGFSIISKKCERALIKQIYDPAQTYFNYTKARSVFNAAGYSELSQPCSESLIQQIYGY